MLAEVDDYDARAILSLQVSDEAKHSDVFEQYASSLGGSPAAYRDAVDELDTALSDLAEADSIGLYFVHTFLECLALDEFAYLHTAFADSLLGDIYSRIGRDEARHVAFGLQYLRQLRVGHGEVSDDDVASYFRIASQVGGIDGETIRGLSRLSRVDGATIKASFDKKAAARLNYLNSVTNILPENE